jgi:hypothetical protein
MAENEAATRDYVVLRCSQEAKPAPRPSGDSATGDVEALKPTPEQWEVVDTVAARSDSEARKVVVRGNMAELKTATLVAVPQRFWTPQKPKVREQEPIIDFEDA